MYHQAFVGKKITELPTPCLLLDLDALDHNISVMQGYVSKAGKNLRPHIKAHKCPMIAHLQLDAGACGVTCAKLGEAIVMAEAGIKEILLANQIIGADKIRVLAGLNRYAKVMPCIDAKENATEINAIAAEMGVTIPVFLEVNIGLERCGVRTVEEGVALAQHISTLGNLSLRGIQAYEGRPFGCDTPEVKQAFVDKWVGFAIDVKKAIEAKGIEVKELSSACTGTAYFTAKLPEVTEVQPGSYTLMESIYDPAQIGLPFKQAIHLQATVCSVHPGRIVLNAGEKAVTVDQGTPVLYGDPDAKLVFHEEHCLIDTTPKLANIKTGDLLKIIPSHCCTTANQHQYFFCHRNGVVESVWHISAQGRYE